MTVEEPCAKRILEVLDLKTDSAVGDTKLRSGVLEAQMARCRLECADRIQRRKHLIHNRDILNSL